MSGTKFVGLTYLFQDFNLNSKCISPIYLLILNDFIFHIYKPKFDNAIRKPRILVRNTGSGERLVVQRA